jgi:outer membrane lipoprotein-sorting protein
MKIFYTILLVSILSTVMAQTETFVALKDVEAFKTKMSATNKSYISIKSDFVQEKYLSFMKQKMVSKGHLKYKASNMMLLQYSSPMSYSIAFVKDKVWINDNGKVTKFDVKSNKIFKFINQTMLDAVQGKLFENKDYTVKYAESNSQYLLELEPVSPVFKNYLKLIKIYINKKDYTVNTLEMHEKSGDNTKMIFSNKQLNTVIANEEFVVK